MINSFRRIASSSRTIIVRHNDTNKRWNNHLISNKYGKKIVNYYSTLPINNFHHQMKDSATFERFKLSTAFVNQFADRKPPFGFNGLGELVYRRTYARELENGRIFVYIHVYMRNYTHTYTCTCMYIYTLMCSCTFTCANQSKSHYRTFVYIYIRSHFV